MANNPWPPSIHQSVEWPMFSQKSETQIFRSYSCTVFPMWLVVCPTIKNTSTGIIPARKRTTIYQCYTHSQVCPSPTYQLEYVIRHALDVEHYNNPTRVYMRYTRTTVRFGGCGLGLAMIMMMMISPGKPQGLTAILKNCIWRSAWALDLFMFKAIVELLFKQILTIFGRNHQLYLRETTNQLHTHIPSGYLT